MSAFNRDHPPQASDHQEVASSSGASGGTVSGIPFVPVYAPPMGHDYGMQQQQFPPPLPQPSYHQYGTAQVAYKAPYPQMPGAPPPPSIYYSRYPTPPQYPMYPTPQQYQVSHPVRAMPRSFVPQAGMTPSPQPPQSYNSGRVYTMTFDDGEVRDDYVKRILSLILIQLIISAALSAIGLEVNFVNDVVKSMKWLIWLSVMACISVVVFTKMRPATSRKRVPERCLFIAWSVGLISLLTWITSMFDVKFLLILQTLLAIILFSLLAVSHIQKSSLLAGRSMVVSTVALVAAALCLGAFYAPEAGVVFFGIFVSTLIMLFFLFRLHYLMGDECRKLQPHEVFTGATSVFF